MRMLTLLIYAETMQDHYLQIIRQLARFALLSVCIGKTAFYLACHLELPIIFLSIDVDIFILNALK